MSNIIKLNYNALSPEEKELVKAALETGEVDKIYAFGVATLQAIAPNDYTDAMLAKANFLSLEVQTKTSAPYLFNFLAISPTGWVDEKKARDYLARILPNAAEAWANASKAWTSTTTLGYVWC